MRKDKDDEKEALAIKIGDQIIKQQDLEFTVVYNNETFTLKYPTPIEKAQIELDIAAKLQGHPRESFPQEHLVRLEIAAYVNSLLIPEKSPAWFKSAWTCYDEELVAELYSAYLTFRQAFQERLRTGKFNKAG